MDIDYFVAGAESVPALAAGGGRSGVHSAAAPEGGVSPRDRGDGASMMHHPRVPPPHRSRAGRAAPSFSAN